jgi:parallel beta-helix repeat protein
MKPIPGKLLFIVLVFLTAAFCFCDTLVVGQGSQYKTIQMAIDAAEEGDEIVIKGGRYSQPDSIYIEGKTRLEIRGEGRVTITCTEYVPVIYMYGSRDIIIRNIHGVHNVTDPDVGKGMCGPGATVITVEECRGVSVLDCELDGCGQSGIECVSSNDIVITGNYIHDNVNSAVMVYDVEFDGQSNVRIENNRIEDNHGPVVVSDAIGRLTFHFQDSGNAPGIVIEGNTWKNNDRMPRVSAVVAGRSIVFRGNPDSYEDDNGRLIIYAGILSEDTDLIVGNAMVTFLGMEPVFFHENGRVSGGFCARALRVVLKDGRTIVLPAGGWRDFDESGGLISAELEDGAIINFSK